MANEITIPLLPCKSITETVAFYEALGFELTYQQTRPNAYACVQRDAIGLHFFTMPDFDPAQSYGSCIIQVPNADEIYQAFSQGLRQLYGKIPLTGIPRLNRLKNKAGGIRGFNVIDPGGNWLRIGQKLETAAAENAPTADTSKLARAIQAADLLSDSKGDYATAAKVLDKALAQAQDEPVLVVEHVQALVLRATIAHNLNDFQLARNLLAEIQQLPLQPAERAELGSELAQAQELEQLLQANN